MLSPLSYLKAVFDASCQSFAITTSAVGVGGGVSASAAYLTSAKNFDAVSVSIPMVLEVIQDQFEVASDNGIIIGGRSASGFSAGPPSSVDIKPRATAASTVVSVTVNLALEPQYVIHILSAITPPLRLFSLLAAWLSLLGIGTMLLRAHMAAASKLAGAATLAELEAITVAKNIDEIVQRVSNQSTKKLGGYGGGAPHGSVGKRNATLDSFNKAPSMPSVRKTRDTSVVTGLVSIMPSPRRTYEPRTPRPVDIADGDGHAVESNNAVAEAAAFAVPAGGSDADGDSEKQHAVDNLSTLPPGWVQLWSDRHQTHYYTYHDDSTMTTWERPV